MIPAVAIPVGAPTAELFFLPIIPRIKPTTAVMKPKPKVDKIVRDAIPKISAAIDIPLPGIATVG